ncbi:hypothetical protein CEXT_69031 [Caerostris extrusa]|uniref:Uncharacterized protein n=1 Tax=Caerostris extrusa TaxID=172846 RepID=A0AAV4T897_CAEEX|nr:hypothetical protein CEXT_69031 [Caerostris extrusa]
MQLAVTFLQSLSPLNTCVLLILTVTAMEDRSVGFPDGSSGDGQSITLNTRSHPPRPGHDLKGVLLFRREFCAQELEKEESPTTNGWAVFHNTDLSEMSCFYCVL